MRMQHQGLWLNRMVCFDQLNSHAFQQYILAQSPMGTTLLGCLGCPISSAVTPPSSQHCALHLYDITLSLDDCDLRSLAHSIPVRILCPNNQFSLALFEDTRSVK